MPLSTVKLLYSFIEHKIFCKVKLLVFFVSKTYITVHCFKSLGNYTEISVQSVVIINHAYHFFQLHKQIFHFKTLKF
jgi:hypothetical protein